MDERGSDSRKRRRITPVITAVPSTEVTGTVFTTSSAEAGSWDFLAKWEATDDTVVGDTEEEYHFDASDGSPAAMDVVDYESEGDDALPEGPATRPSKLGADEVTNIINDCIEMYTNAWTPGKGEFKYKDETGQTEVPVIYDAITLWEEAEAAGQRQELAEKYEVEAEYYRQRLDKLCEEISKDPGDTIAGVQMKCRNLEVTVELLERATWLEDIYKLPPDASSDNEAQDSILTDRTLDPATQPTASFRLRNPLSQVIDLTKFEPSKDGIAPLDDILTTPAQTNNIGKQERISPTHLSTLEATVFSPVEVSKSASRATSPLTVRSRVPLGDAPETASIPTVRRWSWAELEESQDRKRAVSKAIYELSSADKEVLRQRLQKVGKASMVREIPACVDMLLRGDKKIPGVLPQDLLKIINFTRLFFCWWLCGNHFHKTPSEVELAELRDYLQNSSSDPLTFCDYVGTVLSTTFSSAALNRLKEPLKAEVIEISDDEAPLQLHKWRRRSINKPASLDNAITID